MVVFPVTGEASIYLKYSGNLIDAYASLASSVLVPPTSTYLHFTAGTTGLIVGKNIIGGTSSATANVVSIVITSGALADSDAQGIIFIKDITGTWAIGENITIAGPSTIGVCRSVVLRSPMIPAKTVFLQAESNSLRLCWDGLTPTHSTETPASMGVLIQANENLELSGWNNVSQLKFINAVSASNGVLNVVVSY